MLRTRSTILGTFVLVVGLSLGAGCGDDEGLKVKSWSPKEGPFGGGDPVTIKGTGFQSSATRKVSVYFGTNKAQVLEMQSDQIVVRPPGGNVNETVPIRLVFENAKGTIIKDAYKYIDPAPLKVDDLNKGAAGTRPAP